MCFLRNTQVSIADSNRGKCKVSKEKIAKGDLRFGWRVGKETWVNCLVDYVHLTVIPATLGPVPTSPNVRTLRSPSSHPGPVPLPIDLRP